METKFNSDVDLPLSKTSKPHNMVIVVRPVFHERNITHKFPWMNVYIN